MKMIASIKGRAVVALLTLAGVLAAGSALADPCGEGAVNIGDTPEVVAARCGEAMFKEERRVKTETLEGKRALSSSTTIVEEWTFNRGPEEPLLTYRFEDGKLAGIVSSGYGGLPDTADTCRNGELLAVGDSSLEVYLKCGEPLAKERRADKVTVTTSGGVTQRVSVPVVEWTYRYGPDLPGVTLRMENGRIAALRPREFGK